MSFLNLPFFSFILVIKTLDPDPNQSSLEMLNLDSDSMNPDPQHWFVGNFLVIFLNLFFKN